MKIIDRKKPQTGKVIEILKNGNVSVTWSNGEPGIVKRVQLEEVYRQSKRFKLINDPKPNNKPHSA